MNKKFAAIGLGAGLAIGAGVGFALEASGTAGASSAVLAVTATTDTAGTTDAAIDATADAARPDPTNHLQTVLQPLVEAGTITQAQADAVIEALVAARPEGRMGDHGGRHGGGGMGGRGAHLETVATAIGISAEEVRTGLEDGQTIAELAVANGTTAERVIDALVAEATTRINQAVTDGKLTQADADTKLADVETRVTEFVNSTPQFGRGHGAADDAASTDPVVTTAG